jgi:hypothetical protein
MTRIARLVRLLTAPAALASMLAATPAQAQEPTLPLPKVEVGGTSGGLLPIAVGDGARVLISGGPVVTVNPMHRVRFDLSAEAFAPNESSGLWGLYLAQARFPLTTSADGLQTLFLTAGAAGLYSHQRSDEYRQTRADGSIVVTPAWDRWRVTKPRIAAIGIAHQRILNRRTSLMLSVRTMVGEGAIIVQGGAGLSFGAGRYR